MGDNLHDDIHILQSGDQSGLIVYVDLDLCDVWRETRGIGTGAMEHLDWCARGCEGVDDNGASPAPMAVNSDSIVRHIVAALRNLCAN